MTGLAFEAAWLRRNLGRTWREPARSLGWQKPDGTEPTGAELGTYPNLAETRGNPAETRRKPGGNLAETWRKPGGKKVS